MTLDADLIVDNRRVRRKLTFWRAATVLVLIGAFLALGSALSKQGMLGSRSSAHVAKIAVTGMINYEPKMIALLKRIETNDAAKALVVYIDSPGGSTAGSEALYNSLRRIAAKKPVVAQIGALGASGAYVTALGTDRIFATKTSLVGSIGVLVQWAEFDKLIETWGVRFQEVKTSPLKASPNGFEPATPEAKAALKALVDDSFLWFKGLVAERRSMDETQLKTVADGRVFTGSQSLNLKLIDEIGDEQSALNWLIDKKKIDAKLPLETYKVDEQRLPNWLGAAARVAGLFGLSAPWLSGFEALQPRLDGLVSVWQPSGGVSAATP